MTALSNSSATIRDYDNTHYMHPWEVVASMGKADRTISASAEGIYIYDGEGKRLIDGPGGMWCTQIGNGRRDMADAIAEQTMRLAYHSPWNTSCEPGALLAHKLAELSPGDLNTVFFTTGGSTAVDSAIRYMHFYNNRLGRPEKKMVIGRAKGYHGSTYLAASATGRDRKSNALDVDDERFHLLPDVNPSLRPDGMSMDDWAKAKATDLEDAILKFGADKVGAFIAEPLLASGGVIIPAPGYHKLCLEVCRKHDVLYISDEVVTGFGRLGHWFSSEDVFDIVPDMITCAKGLTSGYLPLGACLISDRLVNELKTPENEGVMFNNGFTYGGHPVSCAAALKNIEIFENEGILEHVRALTPHFQERLHSLGELPNVAETRGLGFMGCVEATVESEDDPDEANAKFGRTVDKHCEEMGLIVRPIGHMCVFSPPLIMKEKEIDMMFDILREAITRAAAEL